jgi:hypothetical protein
MLISISVSIFAAAKQCGDLPGDTAPPLHATITNAFTIPAKKNSSSPPVVVKLFSEHIRGLIFKHKKDALPTAADLQTNHIRQKYAIYEDLTPATHKLLRSFADDPRVKSAWSFSGQICFKTHNDDTIHKVTSLSSTYDSIIKPPSSTMSNTSTNTSTNSSTIFATRQQMKDRVALLADT